MPNRLAGATSPYLLQHKDNPVDWWQWGDEAFAEARRRDVPVLLSVGYSACHWCHVMAHESFEDESTAALMNANFVSVKVDREERPDVDAVYMEATTALTGSGGWPMSVFLDHEGRAFYAGTYFPAEPRHGMPSFSQLLTAVSSSWLERRQDVLDAAGRIDGALRGRTGVAAIPGGEGDLEAPDPAELDAALSTAVDRLAVTFDPTSAGFGDAPKFPPSMVLEFLVRHHARTGDDRALDMALRTAHAMARGGLYDQLGGGFARYSVDAGWVVPHFEKMLYDNALLLRAFLHLWRSTADAVCERVVRETAVFLLDEMRTREGGFAAALDADSEGEEGRYYVWTPSQLVAVLGDEDGAWAAEVFTVTQGGTFEHGSSTLQYLADAHDPPRLARVRTTLAEARAERVRPSRDDKVVAAWNGLAVAALAEAATLFEEPLWLDAALAAGDLLVAVHLGGAAEADGTLGDRLVRVSRDGRPGSHAPGVLEDHADVAEAFLALYSATGDDSWLAFSGVLLDVVLAHFRDPSGAFFDTADDAAEHGAGLVRRPQDPTDSAAPSGWAAAVCALLGYAALTGSDVHREAAERGLALAPALAGRAPRFAGWLLAAAEAWLDGPREVAVVSAVDDRAGALLRRMARLSPAPGLALAWATPESAAAGEGAPLLRDRGLVDGRAGAFVCRKFVCDLPETAAGPLAASLGVLPVLAGDGPVFTGGEDRP